MAKKGSRTFPMECDELQYYLPHRYPMLLIDRVLETVPHRYALGVKAITGNDPIFQGHFKNFAVWPGVLMLESLGQLCTFLYFYTRETSADRSTITLMSMNRVKFRTFVRPGDLLYLKVQHDKLIRGKVGKFETMAYTLDPDGRERIACQAEILAMQREEES